VEFIDLSAKLKIISNVAQHTIASHAQIKGAAYWQPTTARANR
jgi:hypothetical protein